MPSFNKVIVAGNLGSAPEVKFMPNGDAVANVSLAVNEKWTDKVTGEKKEHVEWVRLVFFRRQAEVLGEYATKGSPILVEGRMKTREWNDKQDVKHYTTEVVVSNLQLLGSKGDTIIATDNGQAGDQQPAEPRVGTPAGIAAQGEFPDVNF